MVDGKNNKCIIGKAAEIPKIKNKVPLIALFLDEEYSSLNRRHKTINEKIEIVPRYKTSHSIIYIIIELRGEQ